MSLSRKAITLFVCAKVSNSEKPCCDDCGAQNALGQSVARGGMIKTGGESDYRAATAWQTGLPSQTP